jgi:hypothetical protein
LGIRQRNGLVNSLRSGLSERERELQEKEDYVFYEMVKAYEDKKE